MISPSAETNEPEPPLLKRTAEDRRCSAQPGGGSKPCLALSVPRGRLLKTHMPSSDWTGEARIMSNSPARKPHPGCTRIEIGSCSLNPPARVPAFPAVKSKFQEDPLGDRGGLDLR